MSNSAYITDVHHLSSHDGRGVRLSLFFKGCPLRCAWCHNPETFSLKRDLLWRRDICIGCGGCMDVCDRGALHLGESIDFVDRELCVRCGKCIDKCPSKALYFASKEYSVEGVAKLIKGDKPLFNSMNGGVTFSGGEPALQAEFITRVIDLLNDDSIHYALDTCGYAPRENYEKLLPHMDQILFDIKEIDPEKHRAFTGQSNELILNNLQYICRAIAESGRQTKIWIRTPLIPDHTANEESISKIASYINTLPRDIVERWDLCCFNNMCSDKYRRMGMEWSLADADLLTSHEAERLLKCAKSGVADLDVRVSGLRKREE